MKLNKFIVVAGKLLSYHNVIVCYETTQTDKVAETSNQCNISELNFVQRIR